MAADTFVQLSLMNLIGGMVIVLGDDPGANSSQNEQDNRHYAHLAYTPVLEPSDPEEVYAYYKEAARQGRERRMPIILRLTTHVCHAKQKIAFAAWNPIAVDRTPRFDAANGPYIPLSATVAELKERALDRLNDFRAYADACPLNRLTDNGNPARGVITWGLPYLSLMDAISVSTDRPDILKLGIVHPIPQDPITAFLKSHQEVLVLEELDDLVEKEIKSRAYDLGLTARIIGKRDHRDWIGEYTPDKVRGILHRIWPEMVPQPFTPGPVSEAPERPPQMCPGCGHRSAFYAIKQALADTDITVAGIGCHTLGYLPPYEIGRLLMCMGASTGIGSGLGLFNQTRRVVVFMGDSTFQQQRLAEIVKAAMAVTGFSVVIARHPCMLKFNREQRRKPGFEPHQVDIDQTLCEQIHNCVARFGCPSFSRAPDGRIEINTDLCIGDGSCVQTCPTHAIGMPSKK